MRRTLLLVAACALALSALACGVGDVARAVRVGAVVAAQEFQDEARGGGLSAADGERLSAWAGEVGAAAGRLERTAARWDSLTPARKRVAVADFVAETAGAQARLEAAGEPVFKSERARKAFAEVNKRLNQVRAVLREYAPPETPPAPTPAPSQ